MLFLFQVAISEPLVDVVDPKQVVTNACMVKVIKTLQVYYILHLLLDTLM